ncbi:hypothetical protein U0070_016476 [Myodes glareolus]|uniref:SEA domain-containing protein n=1 Tax=Myodes glareolus TaxID=447135 RepID=A0AAW0K0L2_MYOGA
MLALMMVAATIGLLAHVLVSGQKMEYYQGTFTISDIHVISSSERKSSNQLKDLQEANEDLVSQIKLSFHRLLQELFPKL